MKIEECTEAEGRGAWLGRGRAPLLVALLPAVVLGLVLGSLLVVAPGVRHELGAAGHLLLEGDPEPLRLWLLEFGIWAPVVSALLQLVTSLFPPFPSFLVSIANAMLYGPLLGGILTWTTSLFAATACFGLARLLGRPGVARIVSRTSLEKVDRFMERRGLWAVFVARVVPFVNPDVVSYAAGVTGIHWRPFLLAIGAGSVPAVAFYSVVGGTALESTLWVTGAVAIATFLPVLLLVVYWRRRRPAGRSDRPGALAFPPAPPKVSGDPPPEAAGHPLTGRPELPDPPMS